MGARTGTLKNPTKCLWRREPDRRSNFFFSPHAHLCTVTFMTEISLIVTLNNQFTTKKATWQQKKCHQTLRLHNDCVIEVFGGIFSVATKHFDYTTIAPSWGPGVKSRMCPPYPKRDRKRRLNGAVSRNNRIKRVAPCRCLDGHVKEPYEMSMALGARP